MKYLIILSFYLFASTNYAFANWTAVSIGKNGDQYFIDYSTSKLIGGYKRLWMLENYKEPLVSNSGTAYSSKNLVEFDCQQDRYRRISSSFYSQPNGGGEPLFTPAIDNSWKFAVPQTNFQNVMLAVCKK